ncbi:hypothetical protein AMATHDRAFT_69578 [Amanita thiersii Skay4041]|uniref:DUF6534 domain-containing protein n=1 Tax=Amanita thiersii Skay4041 TaxID=703135 RepID=A0A2A9NFK2_9AGAR|nr:hypothetical protein AMATHDRAFT_69578 [Amanita thiersii Skay4041]
MPVLPRDYDPAIVSNAVSALLVGYLINGGLFGMLCMQLYYYYFSFPKDALWIKLNVYFIIILEILQTAFSTYDAWSFFASNAPNLGVTYYIWLTVPCLGGVVSFICHIFFAYRIWVITSSKILPAIVSVVATCALISMSLAADRTRFVTTWDAFGTARVFILVGIGAISLFLCDLLIVIFMTYALRRSSSALHIPRTQRLVDRITAAVIETGLLTAMMAMLGMIFYVALGLSGSNCSPYFLLFFLPLTKFYSNAFMALLNSRKIHKDSVYSDHVSVPVTLRWTSQGDRSTTVHGSQTDCSDTRLQRCCSVSDT